MSELARFVRDHRIKKNSPGEFRSRLYSEAVDTRGMEKLEYEAKGGVESVWTCVEDPVYIPVEVYYLRGVTATSDPYLRGLLQYYAYINPEIDLLGVKRMVEYIVRYKVTKDDNGDPILSFDDIADKVWQLFHSVKDSINEASYTVVVLYSKDTRLTKDERRQWTLMVRRTRQQRLAYQIVHEAAISAIDKTRPEIRVTNPKVFGEIPPDTKGLRSVRVMKRNMSETTERLLEQVNFERPFPTQKKFQKFEEFLNLPSGLSYDEMASRLKTSKTNIVQFSTLKKQLGI